MAEANTYLNARFMGEHATAYTAGGLHPVYLGDVLGGRYQVFRKLGSGSQCTVWLARDKSAPKRQFRAVKVYNAKSSEEMRKLVDSLKRVSHPGENHVEVPFDSFTVQGPQGSHLCTVVEPLGDPLSQFVEQAFDKRVELTEGQQAMPGDPWSVEFAKRACRQALVALDYLHSRRIAHRDIAGRNFCFALQYDLSDFDENYILKSVWPGEEKPEEEQPEEKKEVESEQAGLSVPTEAKTDEEQDSDSSSDSSDDDDDRPPPQWKLDFDECEKRIAEQWDACDPGDATAEPLSDAWNKANFFNSRSSIELLQRRDGKSLGPDEIRYTVNPTPLATGFALEDVADPEKRRAFRLVLTDLGFSCPFEECGKHPMPKPVDYMAPEGLLGLPDVPASDVYSLGLWFWEVVMLRGLVVDAGFAQPKDRVLQYLARRLGPVPASLRARWPDADRFVDAEGRSLDTPDQDEEEYGDDFPRGDVWFQGRNRKPLDMSEEDLGQFVHLIQKMLQWEPENRPSTAELLQDPWLNSAS
ncbi:kinase-like domain-containing protein [Apiospora kogelbergensis]|uniref:kinase-like domain-containing protein n=1 Tax=Apiospora kogelbergensis TaxID=1337665 RepID=UPI00312ECFB7